MRTQELSSDGTELPNTLSGLLRVALHDMRMCLIDPAYEVRMDYWYEPGEVCCVCMAGSVLAQTLGFGTLYNKGFCLPELDSVLPRRLQAKLKAINYMRIGNFCSAFVMLPDMVACVQTLPTYAYDALRVVGSVVCQALPPETDAVPEYHAGYYAPLETYELAANFLEELGL